MFLTVSERPAPRYCSKPPFALIRQVHPFYNVQHDLTKLTTSDFSTRWPLWMLQEPREGSPLAHILNKTGIAQCNTTFASNA